MEKNLYKYRENQWRKILTSDNGETFSITLTQLKKYTFQKRENTSCLQQMCAIQDFTNDSMTNCVDHHFWPSLMARA